MSKHTKMSVDARGTTAIHCAGDNCPACSSSDTFKGGILRKRIGTFGEFLGCSLFPKCRFTQKQYIPYKIESKKKQEERTFKQEQRYRLRTFPKKLITSFEL